MVIQSDTIGKNENIKVLAVTDIMGPQVIVKTKDRTFLSPSQKDHETAIDLGNRVWNNEIDYSQWDGPCDDFFTVLSLIANNKN